MERRNRQEAEDLSRNGNAERHAALGPEEDSDDLAPAADAGPVPYSSEFLTPVEPDDEVLSRLIEPLKLPVESIPGEFERPLSDLRAVLGADYRRVPGFPPIEMAHELFRVVQRLIKPYGEIWKCWHDRQSLHQLQKVFKWGDVVINAQPYLQGTGLSLWGFSCEAKLAGRRKFVIYLNTAHDPGAVAATIGHELGHYVYHSIGGQDCGETTAMGSVFTQHLAQEKELFSDAVVALLAYSYPVTRQILTSGGKAFDGVHHDMNHLREAFSIVDPQYRIDLARAGLTAPWRIRYLTLMVHFFKLRTALLDAAGI